MSGRVYTCDSEGCWKVPTQANQMATKMPQPKSVCVCIESLLNESGRGAFILGHTRAQVCPISLTTLPAPPTDTLLRKTRAKRKNWADRVGGSSHASSTEMQYLRPLRHFHTVLLFLIVVALSRRNLLVSISLDDIYYVYSVPYD
jgi:hypothetical protein